MVVFFTLNISAFSAVPRNDEHNTSTIWREGGFALTGMKIHIGLNLVCGYYNNQAEYASFGLEAQPFKCSKITLPLRLSYNHYFSRIEFAPLYNSLKSIDNNKVIVYGNDSHGRPIDGNNPYFDWYKNLGTRIYYLGNVPLLDAYVGWKSPHNKIILGRMKVHAGLADNDATWGDDGMFSPYSYWLSRDLMSGLSYQYSTNLLSIKASLLSGNNPMKGYADYLDHIQSPNLKGNNTPTVALNFSINSANYFSSGKATLTVAMIRNVMSSTWVDSLKDGKRRNSIYAAGFHIDWPIKPKISVSLFGQYTRYLSGLSTESSQYDPSNPYFLDITQSGYFAGVSLHFNKVSLSLTHETFDRFDANVYQNWIDHQNDSKYFPTGTTLSDLKALKQSMNVINLSYLLNRFSVLQINYAVVKNPLEWVSSILDTKPTYRLGLSLSVRV